MKKFVVFMLTALMLFVALPGFAVVDPGSQTDTADIFVGTGNFFSAGGTPLINSDDIGLRVIASNAVTFKWYGNDQPYLDGMFIRTYEETGSVSGSFDISSEEISMEYDDAMGLSIFPERDTFVSGDYGVTVSWDFGAVSGRRVIYGGIDADLGDSSNYFAIGAIKVEQDPTFRVAVYKVATPEVVNDYFYPSLDDEDDPDYELLASFNDVTSADMDLSFTLDRASDGYLVIAIQNWWQNELRLGKHVDVNLLGEDLVLTDNIIDYSKVIYDLTDGQVGSGMSALVIPSDYDIFWQSSFSPSWYSYFSLNVLNGSFDFPVFYGSVEDGGEGNIHLEWDDDMPITSGSSGGFCSVGFTAPSALLLLLPLLFMRKR